MTTTTDTTAIHPLTGRRLTTYLMYRNFGTARIGEVVYLIERTTVGSRHSAAGGNVWLEAQAWPGRINLSRRIAAQGEWMGTSSDVYEVQMGRGVVVSVLTDRIEDNYPRVQVRLISETPEEFARAAEATVTARLED